MIPKKKSKKKEIQFLDKIDKKIEQNEQQNLAILREQLKELFKKSEKFFLSEKYDELFTKLNISGLTRYGEKQRLVSLFGNIPEIIIIPCRLNEKDDYILILKEKINLPQFLKKVLDQKDIIVKQLELIKQYIFVHDHIKKSLIDKHFSIQWTVTDSKKKYWLMLKNNRFGYGEGVINNPSITVSASETNTINYFFQGYIGREHLDIQGRYYQIIALEEVCREIFNVSKYHSLDHFFEEKILEIGFLWKENEERLKKELKLEEEEKERKRMEKKKEKERKRKEKTQYYALIRIKIQNLRKIYDEIKIYDIEKKLPKDIRENYKTILKKDLTSLIENMITNKDIDARIRGEYLTFIKKDLKETTDLIREISKSNQLITRKINVLRGGNWKVEENKSVFYFKVKVRNNSKYVITNIQILLTSIPGGLIPETDKYRIQTLNPDSFESPLFKFIAKDSCVGDFIKGMVLFTDHIGKQQTVPMKPFKIEYVCNLLVPKSITEEKYEKNTATMQERKIIFNCDLTPDKLESEVAQILEQNNFYVLESTQESEKADFRKINAYAEGKYDKQDVALSIIMQKLADQANKLIIKAMSNKQEKIIDLLKDISRKCDPLKSITEDTIPIKIICTNCQKRIIITEYMKRQGLIICEN